MLPPPCFALPAVTVKLPSRSGIFSGSKYSLERLRCANVGGSRVNNRAISFNWTMASEESAVIRGTTVNVRFDRVVDGDTIRVYPPGSEKAESVRILSLDTEESYAYSSKPMTPWGAAAKAFAKSFFTSVEQVTLEFPDDAPLSTALTKHRGNYGRLLVFVWVEGVDFSEIMIRKGYSPYFTKYGHAPFASHRARYIAAERAAQMEGIGVWDQLTVNGAVRLNYAALKTWWDLRAAAVEDFRRVRLLDKSIFDVREDYAALKAGASQSAVVTIFADVREIKNVPGRYAIVDVGSQQRPFSVIVPRVDMDAEEEGEKGKGRSSPEEKVIALLRNRYLAKGVDTPRRGYVFLSGRLRLFRGNPQLVVDDPAAVGDLPGVRPLPTENPLLSNTNQPSVTDDPVVDDGDVYDDDDPPLVPLSRLAVSIASVLPDPAGVDAGNETITLRVSSRPTGVDEGGMTKNDKSPPSISLDGWRIRDGRARTMKLSGSIAVGELRQFTVPRNALTLNNKGDQIFLTDGAGRVVDEVLYTAADVKVGTPVEFPEKE